MPEPKSFEHVRRAVRWGLLSFTFVLFANAVARGALSYASANSVTMTGQDVLVDSLLLGASVVMLLSVIPLSVALRAVFAARQDYDEGYVRLWAAITEEDNRRRDRASAAVAMPTA